MDGTLVSMSKELITDELWEIIEPLLPPEPPKPGGGRPRVEDRAAGGAHDLDLALPVRAARIASRKRRDEALLPYGYTA